MARMWALVGSTYQVSSLAAERGAFWLLGGNEVKPVEARESADA